MSAMQIWTVTNSLTRFPKKEWKKKGKVIKKKMIELMLRDLPCEECAIFLTVLHRLSFIPTEHNAAWTQNKVGEFVPEMALRGEGKRARSSPLFV